MCKTKWWVSFKYQICDVCTVFKVFTLAKFALKFTGASNTCLLLSCRRNICSTLSRSILWFSCITCTFARSTFWFSCTTFWFSCTTCRVFNTWGELQDVEGVPVFWELMSLGSFTHSWEDFEDCAGFSRLTEGVPVFWELGSFTHSWEDCVSARFGVDFGFSRLTIGQALLPLRQSSSSEVCCTIESTLYILVYRVFKK